jgi:methylglyoxal synthase
MTIAVISHDNKKADMVAFILKRIEFFNRGDIRIISTGTTGKHMQHAGIQNVECLKSGPLGGDAQIASRLVEGEVDAVLFFIDPLFSHPHEVDIHMLRRLCNVYDIPLATNYKTAKYLIKGLKYEESKNENKIQKNSKGMEKRNSC